LPAGQRYTAWTFGELPELMEVRRGAQSLIGFPALRDEGDAVTIEVFDEPAVAAAKHRAGLRRLFALQLKRRAQVPREEHSRPAEDGGGLHAAGHVRRAAHADHRRGARPRLPAGAVADRRVRLQEAPGGRAVAA
jgi:hypothetical protein